MKTEKLFRFAIKQIGILLVVIITIPVIGLVSTILLTTLSALFCEQLIGLMTLAVVVTTSLLAAKQLRGDLSNL